MYQGGVYRFRRAYHACPHASGLTSRRGLCSRGGRGLAPRATGWRPGPRPYPPAVGSRPRMYLLGPGGAVPPTHTCCTLRIGEPTRWRWRRLRRLCRNSPGHRFGDEHLTVSGLTGNPAGGSQRALPRGLRRIRNRRRRGAGRRLLTRTFGFLLGQSQLQSAHGANGAVLGADREQGDEEEREPTRHLHHPMGSNVSIAAPRAGHPQRDEPSTKSEQNDHADHPRSGPGRQDYRSNVEEAHGPR